MTLLPVLCLCANILLVLGNNGLVHNHVDITLIGAYGDLAKKYLWNAIFKLYENTLNESWTYQFFGAASKNVSVGHQLLNEVLKQGLKCSNDTIRKCHKSREKFLNQIRYVQLKSEEDYAKHCSSLFDAAAQHHCHKGHACEYQNIMYLSVPPFVYETVSNHIALHCRPVKGAGSLKVIFEKPFGHSKTSAANLMQAINKNLLESETYRVDHYLGKQAVQAILPFRKNNYAVEKMLNSRFVERVEIVMKEKISVQGRTNFYDKYGVIADVMQNHLSEILYLLTMELPMNLTMSNETMKNKFNIVRQIKTLTEKDIVMGQYQDYQAELSKESVNCSKAHCLSKTPTFAGAKLKISSARWLNVPIIMVAGKKLYERITYARVVFKEDVFSVQSNHECSQKLDLIFHIGHGPLGKPAILASRNLDVDVLHFSDEWMELPDLSDDLMYLGKSLLCYKVFTPRVVHDAYEFLFKQLFHGHQEHFLSSSSLLESWRVWGPVIEKHTDSLHYYSDQSDSELDFRYISDELEFLNPTFRLDSNETFLGRKVTYGSNDLTWKKLALEVVNSAQLAIKEKGEFHIAFSGGTSPHKLFDSLVTYCDKTISWENVHVWQVDERCSLNSSLSNFDSLISRLINKLSKLKYLNIHPMPIETSSVDLCEEESAKLYEKWLRLHLGSPPQLDFIVLGMGNDGHTASLFPYHRALKEKERLVVIADETPHLAAPKRMTITYPLISLSKKIVILAMHKSKCELLQEINTNQSRGNNVEKFPICKIPTMQGQVSWYIHDSCRSVLG